MSKRPPFKVKPFIKWAGGKSKLSTDISELFQGNSENYFEPFVGGGAVFLKMKTDNRSKKYFLNDKNSELICTYKTIQESVEELINELNLPKYKYDRIHYSHIREIDPKSLSNVEVSARFIYLNKSCFNGLYRVNRNGKFNVPFGKYDNPLICEEQNLRAWNKLLDGVEITNNNFEDLLDMANPGDFVYLDPPYHPISDTANFSGYTSSGFSGKDQERLFIKFSDLCKNGVFCVESNSSSQLIRELYSNYKIIEKIGTRSVGGGAESRVSVKELLISSF